MLRNVLFIIVSLSCFIRFSECAPYYNLEMQNIQPYAGYRGPYTQIGDWISSSSWFPLEINVPEVIGNFVNGIATFPTTVSNSISGVVAFVQRIPFINRLISPEQPRPYLIILPDKPVDVQDRSTLHSYSQEMDVFHHYP